MVRFIVRILGRSLAWRLGRSLYMAARGEIANNIKANGELDLLLDVARVCRDRSVAPVFLDVGANVGEWTHLALRAGAHVHAFEPVASTFSRLAASVGGRATTNQLALSDHVGETVIHTAGKCAGTNSLSPSMGGLPTTSERIATTTADRYAADRELGIIHLMKIDAEGHDFFVLQGASQLLRSGRLWVAQFEYNCRWLQSGKSMWSVFELAEELGLVVARVVPGRLEAIPTWNCEIDRFIESNFALVQPDILPLLSHANGAWDRFNAYVTARPAAA